MRQWLFVCVYLLIPGLAEASAIEGVWREIGGPAVVRIKPCADGAGLCATLVETRTDGVNERVAVAALRATGAAEWRGRYVLDRDSLPATIRLNGADRADMTAYKFVLCRPARERAGDADDVRRRWTPVRGDRGWRPLSARHHERRLGGRLRSLSPSPGRLIC